MNGYEGIPGALRNTSVGGGGGGDGKSTFEDLFPATPDDAEVSQQHYGQVPGAPKEPRKSSYGQVPTASSSAQKREDNEHVSPYDQPMDGRARYSSTTTALSSGGGGRPGYVKRKGYTTLAQLRAEDRQRALKAVFERRFVKRSQEPVELLIEQKSRDDHNNSTTSPSNPERHTNVDLFLFDDVLLAGSRNGEGTPGAASPGQSRFQFAERIFLPGARLIGANRTDDCKLVIDTATAQNRRNVEAVKNLLMKPIEPGAAPPEIPPELLEAGKVYTLVFRSKQRQSDWQRQLEDVLAALPDNVTATDDGPGDKRASTNSGSGPLRARAGSTKKKSFLGTMRKKMSRASQVIVRPNKSKQHREGASRNSRTSASVEAGSGRGGGAAAPAAAANPAVAEHWARVLKKAGVSTAEINSDESQKVLMDALAEWTESKGMVRTSTVSANQVTIDRQSTAALELNEPTKKAPLRRSSTKQPPSRQSQQQTRDSARASVRRPPPTVHRLSATEALATSDMTPVSAGASLNADMDFLNSVIDGAQQTDAAAVGPATAVGPKRRDDAGADGQRNRAASFVVPGVSPAVVEATQRKPSRPPPLVARTGSHGSATMPPVANELLISSGGSNVGAGLAGDLPSPKRPAPNLAPASSPLARAAAVAAEESPPPLPAATYQDDDALDSDQNSGDDEMFAPLPAPPAALPDDLDDEAVDELAKYVKKAMSRRRESGGQTSSTLNDGGDDESYLPLQAQAIVEEISDDDNDETYGHEMPPDDTGSDMELDAGVELALGMGNEPADLLDELAALDSFMDNSVK